MTTVADPALAGLLQARCGCLGSQHADPGKQVAYLKVRVPCKNGHPEHVEPDVIFHVAHEDIRAAGTWPKEPTPSADIPEPKPKASRRRAGAKTTRGTSRKARTSNA